MSSELAALPPSSGSSSLSPSEVLERAHDVILEKGWCQNRLQDAEGRVCALGAIAYATHGIATAASQLIHHPDSIEADLYLRASRRLTHEIGLQPIPEYNDDPRTSKEGVLLAFKRAAERARLEGH